MTKISAVLDDGGKISTELTRFSMDIHMIRTGFITQRSIHSFWKIPFLDKTWMEWVNGKTLTIFIPFVSWCHSCFLFAKLLPSFFESQIHGLIFQFLQTAAALLGFFSVDFNCITYNCKTNISVIPLELWSQRQTMAFLFYFCIKCDLFSGQSTHVKTRAWNKEN